MFYIIGDLQMTDNTPSYRTDEKTGSLNVPKQNLKNKKIYFDSDGTEIKIGYDDETGTGFVELITE